MKNCFPIRFWPTVMLPMLPILLALSGVAPFGGMVATANGQAAPSATQSLLDKAHALEVRGRMDMASQTWQQVLLADPNSTEALGGMARAAKLSGDQKNLKIYLDKLRAINPNDPGIARAENMGTDADHQVQLREAGKLARQGQYPQAMVMYRKVYGDTPPPGDMALAFYETEAATEDGRPHAIAGLRSLAEKNPADSRYQIALGRILTYNPKTRPEGRKLLAAHPSDAGANEALRQSLLWDAQNPATGGDIRAYLAKHPDAQLATALRAQPQVSVPAARKTSPAVTEEQRAAAQVNAARNAESQAAYRTLNGKHLDQAETQFKAILAKSPDDSNALAGMGYIRMQQANFGGAISYLVQAKQNGSKDSGLDPALQTSRFWYTMGEGAIALNDNDLKLAEKQYRTALGMRPTSVEALEGLGGTLLRSEQPETAVPFFQQFVKLRPSASHAWRGLFLAELGAGNGPLALQTEKQIPAAPRAELAKDPLYLRALASAYQSAGREADAQRVLKTALDLPFPADTRSLQADTQMQYADLLQQAGRFEQAAGLFRQVLAKDENNLAAWEGLVRVQHALGQDSDALQTFELMPPTLHAAAMKDVGFESTVASIYQGQGQFAVAQTILENANAQQLSAGQKPLAGNQVQLAAIYLQQGDMARAYPLYVEALRQNPARAEIWKQVIGGLHNSGRDEEALAEVPQIPPATRSVLERDPEYLQTIAQVYQGLGQLKEAQVFLRRVQQHYAQEQTAAPAEIAVQDGWLLYNLGDDAGLYRQLMELGSRSDLTDVQRRTVQTIWANWAVRRANQAVATGNAQRAVAILNATAQSFPDNPGVIKALAAGYASAGMSKQAVLIWKAQDLKSAPASDYAAAVGAALSANDQKDAEIWLRFGLEQYPRNSDLLILGAKFEQARGDTNRAADYYRASLSAMPKVDPGAALANELRQPAPSAGRSATPQDLARLLGPGAADRGSMPLTMEPQAPVASRPYLPGGSTGYGSAPIQMSQPSMPGAMGNLPAVPEYPSNSANPSDPSDPSDLSTPSPASKAKPGSTKTRLRDYVPQASVQVPLPLDGEDEQNAPTLRLVSSTNDRSFGVPPEGSRLVLVSASYQAGQQQQQQVESSKPPRLTTQPASVIAQQQAGSGSGTAAPGTVAGAAGQEEVYGPYVPYKAPTPIVVTHAPAPPVVPAKVPDEAHPVARYLPNAKGRPSSSSRMNSTAANGAAIRNKQSEPQTGESKPPVEDYSTTQVENAVYTSAKGAGTGSSGQSTQPQQGGALNNPSLQGQTGSTMSYPQQGDSNGQQYPQPRTGASPTHNRRPASRAKMPIAPVTPAAATQAEPQPQPGISYPPVQPPLSAQPYTTIGPVYPLGAPPTDYDLMQKRVPPLRGGYDVLVTPVAPPLTQRQRTELDLEELEASYSGWLGGSGSARYRSGTVGLDRLTDLEATVEASYVAGNNVRFTVVPRAVFLNSGTLNTAAFLGQTSGVPALGTLLASAANAPAQQVASGVGGELQASGRNFAAAIGYTPYEFLVRNVTGRALFKPNPHITLYANRDQVTETQLSYAGLRDPGSLQGNIWGGVVATGGGVRYDMGDARAGFYVTADGADITGYHVLQNYKFEGSAGAYFLVHNFSNYGRLNVGASIFGMHYAHNERGLSYGQGGYFSPEAYFLASIPVTFTGHYGDNFHYSIAGSLGVQTFQEDSALYFPLDPGIQNTFASTANGGLPCTVLQTANHTCAQYPVNSNTGGNYGLNAEGAYRIYDHWYAGGFLTANNTNNYNTVTGGFFVRYLFRRQVPAAEYPTGLFPAEGFRLLRVP